MQLYSIRIGMERGVGVCSQTNFHGPTRVRSLFELERNVGCSISRMELDLW